MNKLQNSLTMVDSHSSLLQQYRNRSRGIQTS